MTRRVKVDRARRSLLKATVVVLGAIGGYGKTALAQSSHEGNDNDDGGRVCFLRGTRLRTASGYYRPVEALNAGDWVTTHFAGTARVKRTSSFTLHRSGVGGIWVGASRPVRVKRNALGENVPAADVCLTAAHAVFFNGFLIPIGNLINGSSIVHEAAEGSDKLDFFHVELTAHDVLDVEGAPFESLRRCSVRPCAPLIGFHGGRSELRSRLRSAAAVIVDRRLPIDVIRDDLEERGLDLMRGA